MTKRPLPSTSVIYIHVAHWKNTDHNKNWRLTDRDWNVKCNRRCMTYDRDKINLGCGVCVCFNINCAHKQMCVYKCHSCRQLYLPASGASWRLVSQIRGDLLEPTASKAEEVGWKSTNSSLPWPGRRVSSGLPDCCSSGSHKCHSFTCTHMNTQRRGRGWNIKTVGGRVSCLNFLLFWRCSRLMVILFCIIWGLGANEIKLYCNEFISSQ